MAASQHEDKMFGLQRQLRHNQQDLQDFISDLRCWEDEIKIKEQNLKKKSSESQDLPPVRNSLDKKKLKKKRKKKSDRPPEKAKISGFDFRAWDKFDVDKALAEIDGEDKKSSSEYETDEEWERERKKHLAVEEKNTGNSHLSAGAYEVAVECYTRGMDLDPTNPLLPANRALALLKMERFGAAEVDCTTAISLDPMYVKAYLRRAAARASLRQWSEAVQDYHTVLKLEPHNKQASAELLRMNKEMEREKGDSTPAATSLEKTETKEVKAIYKPTEQRSKKPLRRIEIQEIGLKEDTERRAAIARTEAKQSSAKKALEAKEAKTFEKFTTKAGGEQTDIANTTTATTTTTSGASQDPALPEQQQETSGGGGSRVKDPASQEVSAPSSQTSKSQPPDTLSKEASRILNGSSSSSSSSSVSSSSTSKPTSPRGGPGSVERKPPETAFQFQNDFRALKNDLPAFYAYFKMIDPTLYPKLFGKSLEAPMLLKIVEAIRTCGVPANDDFFHQLKCLAEVNRFSTTIMFFSAKEKQGIKELFHVLRTRGNHAECDVDSLSKKYEV